MRGLPPLAWVALGVTLGWVAVEIAAREVLVPRGGTARVTWALVSLAGGAGVAVADYLLLERAGEPYWAIGVAGLVAAVYAAAWLAAGVALLRRRRGGA